MNELNIIKNILLKQKKTLLYFPNDILYSWTRLEKITLYCVRMAYLRVIIVHTLTLVLLIIIIHT